MYWIYLSFSSMKINLALLPLSAGISWITWERGFFLSLIPSFFTIYFCYSITPILRVTFLQEEMAKMQNKIWFIIPKYFVENSGTKKWLKKGREQGQNEGLRWPNALLPIMGHPAYCKKWAQANKKYAVTCLKSKWQHLFFWKP